MEASSGGGGHVQQVHAGRKVGQVQLSELSVAEHLKRA
jgi:hypothetical protein